jgi:hypothetical protein
MSWCILFIVVIFLDFLLQIFTDAETICWRKYNVNGDGEPYPLTEPIRYYKHLILWSVVYQPMLYANPIEFDIRKSTILGYEPVETYLVDNQLFEFECLGPNAIFSEDYFYGAMIKE